MKKHCMEILKTAGQHLGGFYFSPSRAQIQTVLLTTGMVLLSAGLIDHAFAADGEGAEMTAQINDVRIADAVKTLLGFIEGSFGALVMVVSGIGAIMGAAFGQYKAALGCLVVAVGSFILRTFMYTFFDTRSIEEAEGQ